MSDLVCLGENGFQVGAYGVAILAVGDEDVRGGGRHAGGDLPNMQVVDLGHVRPGGERSADRLG